MRRTGLRLLIVLALASGGVHAAPPALSPVEGRTPVIVELFTSEGCEDCPPADTLLEKLMATQSIAGAEIIGLGEHVTYWDQLGWKDRFSAVALTNRQQSYQARFRTESIYTPQMVVDGRSEFVGSDASAARKAIEKTLTAPHGTVTLEISGVGAELATPGRGAKAAAEPALRVGVSIAALPRIAAGDRADIIVMITESGLKTEVKRGENRGRTLSHAPVVRYMATIGQVAGDGGTSGAARAEIPLAADWQRDRLSVVSFVQEAKGRTILAAASLPLKNARP